MFVHIQKNILSNSSFFVQKGWDLIGTSKISLPYQEVTIDRSVTLDNCNYHLVSLHHASSQSYFATAVKIAHYLTVTIPSLAMSALGITEKKNYYYDTKNYINDFASMLKHHPKEAQAIVLLDPHVLYKKTHSEESNLVKIFKHGSSEERKALSRLIKNDPGAAFTIDDKKALFDIAITPNSLQGTNCDGRLEIIQALNTATKGSAHKDLTKEDLNKILKSNYELWAYLTSKTNLFSVNPKSVELDLNYFYEQLKNPNQDQNKLTALYNADPTVLTREDTEGNTVFIKLMNQSLHYFPKRSLDWIIKTDLNSILNKKTTQNLFKNISKAPLSHTFTDAIKALNIATQGAIFQDLTKEDLNKILKSNYELWTYLTSKTNPFSVNPKLIKIDLDYFCDLLKYPNQNQKKLTDLHHTDPTVLTREDAKGNTVFMKLLDDLRYELEPEKAVDWIIKTNIHSILTKKNTGALFNKTSRAYLTSYLKILLTTIIRQLNTETKGAIHKGLTQEILTNIKKLNLPLWNYLTNTNGNNPYPVDPKLYTPPKTSSNSSSSSRGGSSRTSPPPRAPSSFMTPYHDYLTTLRTLSGETEQPIKSQSEIKNLYKIATLKWHPDRNKSPQATSATQELTKAYRLIQETFDFKKLPVK